MDFKFLINDYQNIDPDDGKLITFDMWEDIPQNITVKDIRATNTQRYRDFGLIDHIQLELSENSSTLFGLWILGCYYQKKYSHYTLQLTHNNSDIKTIKIIIEKKTMLNVNLDSFEWFPERIDNFELPFYTSVKPQIKLTHSSSENFNAENYVQRSALEGFGKLSAACALAEFFLNFGHSLSNNINYDYLKEKWSRDFLSSHSCEVRVHKINAVKVNIFNQDI